MKGWFFINESNGQWVSKTDFLTHLRQKKDYSPIIQSNNFVKFYADLILGLLHQDTLTILESDFSTTNLQPPKAMLPIQKKNILKPENFETMEEVVRLIKKSKAKLRLRTSGTTGKPRLITHPLRLFIQSSRIGIKYATHRWALAYNPSHMAGLQVFFQALLNHNPLVNIFKASRNDIFRQIAEYQITHISATPTFYRLLLPTENSFPSVKRITLGGELSSFRLHEKLRKTFPIAKLNNIYSTTETGTLFISKGEKFQVPELLIPFIKDENGELLLHRSLVNISQEIQFVGEWYKTGDRMEWLDEEHFRIIGRTTDTVNVAGNKVNLREIELELEKNAKIRRFRVFARKNSVTGNIICCDVEALDARLKPHSIKNGLRKSLKPYKVPRIINLVHKIEQTDSGKVRR